jgi:uncharacterized protein
VPLLDSAQVVQVRGLPLIGTLIEELTYRGLFQAQLGLVVSPTAASGVVSLVFARMHLTASSPPIVLLDRGSALLDSVFYGFIFVRGNTIWLVWLAHFVAVLSAVVALKLV